MDRNATLAEMVAPLHEDTKFMAAFNNVVVECRTRDARERGLIAIRNNLINQGKTRQAAAVDALPFDINARPFPVAYLPFD